MPLSDIDYPDGGSYRVYTDQDVKLAGVQNIDWSIEKDVEVVYHTGGKPVGFTPGITREGKGTITMLTTTFDDWFDSTVAGNPGGAVGRAVGAAAAGGLAGGLGGALGGAIAGTVSSATEDTMEVFLKTVQNLTVTVINDNPSQTSKTTILAGLRATNVGKSWTTNSASPAVVTISFVFLATKTKGKLAGTINKIANVF